MAIPSYIITDIQKHLQQINDRKQQWEEYDSWKTEVERNYKLDSYFAKYALKWALNSISPANFNIEKLPFNSYNWEETFACKFLNHEFPIVENAINDLIAPFKIIITDNSYEISEYGGSVLVNSVRFYLKYVS